MYVITPFNEKNNVLIDATSLTVDQEGAQNINNEIDVTIGGWYVSVESMMGIITKRVLDFIIYTMIHKVLIYLEQTVKQVIRLVY